MDSPVSRSDSSSEPCEGSDCDLMAPLPLSCVYTAPPLVGPASSVAGTDHASAERERAVIRARQLPVDRRLVNFFVSETVLRRSSLWRDMAGGVANDPFTAYQEAVKVMSAKKGSSRKRPKSGGVTPRSVQQSADMAHSAGSLAVALSNLNLNVVPQDGTVFSIGDPSEFGSLIEIRVSHRPYLSCTISGSDYPVKACRLSGRRLRT
ncbi:hypothetical protein Bca52824_053999 [Brassica carinata]|uniref:Uncharacterized protein n=1 Tax=Brassica carinata TaxID=52824 RepID=A0A8X7ULF5_BRACI|nr:hypothetical protein Bca52824_053999 [Brassica carinata]